MFSVWSCRDSLQQAQTGGQEYVSEMHYGLKRASELKRVKLKRLKTSNR